MPLKGQLTSDCFHICSCIFPEHPQGNTRTVRHGFCFQAFYNSMTTVRALKNKFRVERYQEVKLHEGRQRRGSSKKIWYRSQLFTCVNLSLNKIRNLKRTAGDKLCCFKQGLYSTVDLKLLSGSTMVKNTVGS